MDGGGDSVVGVDQWCGWINKWCGWRSWSVSIVTEAKTEQDPFSPDYRGIKASSATRWTFYVCLPLCLARCGGSKARKGGRDPRAVYFC